MGDLWIKDWEFRLKDGDYPHAFLRTVTDIYTCHLLSKTYSQPFVDIGSKYHKIMKLYPRAFTALRPEIFSYDRIYNKVHDHDDKVKVLKQVASCQLANSNVL